MSQDPSSSARSLRKTRIGRVVSQAMHKSIIVEIQRRVKHPIYKKIVGRSTRLMVHDEKNESQIGDRVHIMETRPLSKHKNWRLIKILEKAK